jgi:alanine racemase
MRLREAPDRGVGTMDADRWRAAVGPAWVEVDLDAIASNTRLVLGLLPPGCRLLAVVKADAYGHGAAEVAAAALEAGAAGLGVSTVAEGLALRAEGIAAPILVFTPPRPCDLGPALEAGLTLTVASPEAARCLAEVARRIGAPATAHLKLDCGMGRYGLDRAGLRAAAAELAALGRPGGPLRWEGVYTHFPRGADAAVTRAQLARFLAMVAEAREAGLRFALRHAAASAALLRVPEACLDMVRVGTLLIGDRPAGVPAPPGLRRAFTLRVEPAQVRVLPAGSTVGYGSAWRARRATRVAVLPVGYADGLDVGPLGPFRRPAVLLRALARALLTALGLDRRLGLGAAAGEVEMGGRRVPILGRVGMQQVVVDCSGLPDEALAAPATVHVRATSVGGHLARLYLRDGVAVRARAGLGPRLALAVRQPGPA